MTCKTQSSVVTAGGSANSVLSPGIGLAIITAVFWGILPIGLKLALKFASPSTIVWFRYAFAWVGLVCILAVRHPRMLRDGLLKPPVLGVVAGVALGANYFGFMQGISFTTPSNAQIMIQIGPMALIVLGLLVFKERLRRLQVVGFILASIGMVLFYHDQLTNFIASAAQYRLGNIWIIFAALTWALYAVLQKHLVRTYAPQQINVLLYGIGALMFLPMVRFGELAALNGWQWGVMIFLGANTLIAYGTLGEALKLAPANMVSMIITLNPMLTLLLLALLSALEVTWIHSETMSWIGYVGAVVVVAGAILVVSRREYGQPKTVAHMLKNNT